MTHTIFSNGFVDIHKGKRPVTYGWAIIDLKTNNTVVSGHSLDETRANNTARRHLPSLQEYTNLVPIWLGSGSAFRNMEFVKQLREEISDMGYLAPESPRLIKNIAQSHNSKRLAEIASNVRIEITRVKQS